MRTIKLLAGGAVAAFALALAACGGGGTSSPLTAPPSTGGSQNPSLSVTVTRDAPASTSSTQRSPEYIPANVQSVTMVVYAGTLATPAPSSPFVPPTGVTPFSSVCQNFPSGATSLSLSSTAPVGADTIVITSYTVPCTGALVTANIASQFSGTGTVTAAGGTVASIFNGGSAVVLQPAAAASGTVLLAITSGSGTSNPSASPNPVNFKTLTETRTVAASEANYTGTFTAVSGNTSVATVAPTSTANSFLVTAVGGGSTTITFTDGAGNSTALTVNVPIGTLQVAWVNNGPTVPLPIPSPQIVSSNGATATPTTAPIAPSQSVSFTATQTGNVTGYTAALTGTGCSATLSATSSTTGAFTVSTTSASAASTCSLAITGIGGQTVTTPITVLAYGSITLLYTAPQVSLQTSPPYQGNQGPAILVGSGSAYADTLYASEPNYIGGFTATVTCPTGASGIQIATVGGTAGATATSATGVFTITATATAVSPPGLPCTIGVTDGNGSSAASPMAVTLTTATGIIQ